jgi:hypothetical protein
LYKTNTLTKKVQEDNLNFEFKKEVYFKVFEDITAVIVEINNANYIESYKFSKINHLIKIIGKPDIDEELLRNYNNSLAEVIYELKHFVIDNYIKGTDEKSKELRNKMNLNNLADEDLQEFTTTKNIWNFNLPMKKIQ